MSARYLALPALDVRNATARQTSWFVGMPGPMTVMGFIRALGLRIGVCPAAVSIVHHNGRYLADWKRDVQFPDDPALRVLFSETTAIAHEMKGASLIDDDDYVGETMSRSVQPSLRCNVLTSLILRFDDEDAEILLRDVEAFLWSARFAGGRVDSFGKPKLFDETNGGLGAARKAIGRGFFLVDRRDIVLTEMRETGLDPLSIILGRLARPAVNRRESGPGTSSEASSEEKREAESAGVNSWFSAAVIGFQALEAPRLRVGTRDGVPHCFSEAITGLVQYRSLRGHQPFFWRYAVDPAREAYLVTGDLPERNFLNSEKEHAA